MAYSSADKEIWLIRHPQTDWNIEHRYQGRSDRPLSENGLHESKLLSQFLRTQGTFDELRYSTRAQCSALARMLSEHTIASRMTPDTRLVELDHGAWEGLTAEEIEQRFPGEIEKRWKNPMEYVGHDGESLSQAEERYLKAFDDLLSADTGRRILVIAHKTPIQIFLTHVVQSPKQQYWQFNIATGSISGISKFADSFSVDFVNRSLGVWLHAEADT